MSSNKININNDSNYNLVQISNNNVKYYEDLASQYAAEAEKSVSECASYLAAAQLCISECQEIETEMENYISDELNLHLADLDNPHEVTAEQTGAYTITEVDALLTEINTEIEETELSIEAAYVHSQLTSGNPHNVTASDIGTYTSDEIDEMLAVYTDTSIDLSDYVTESELEEKEYITQTATSDSTSADYQRAYYSGADTTTIVWLEQGGYAEYTDEIESGASISAQITLPTSYNHGYYARSATAASGGFLCSMEPPVEDDTGKILSVTVTNLNSEASSPLGIWWQTSGVPSASSANESTYDTGSSDPDDETASDIEGGTGR